MLTRSVEVELSQLIRLAIGHERAIDGHLDGSAEVLKLSTMGISIDLECDGASVGSGDGGIQVDGRLVLARGAQLVGRLVEAKPVQRSSESGVAKGADGDGFASGVKMGSVVARRQRRSGERERNGCELGKASHF